MAESFVRKAKDDLSCPICMELFVSPNTPKNLSCGHVCCEVCLNQMVAGNSAKSCSECRKHIVIARGGVTKFPTIFRLRTLAENHRKVDTTQSSESETHRCPEHKDEEILYYCATCNASVCKVCLAKEHNNDGHEIVEVGTLYMQQTAEMQATLKSTASHIEQAENLLKQLKVLQDFTNLEDAEKKIDETTEHHMNRLLEENEDLKKQLHQVKNNLYEEKIKKVRQALKVAKRYQQAASTALKYSPKYEYVTQHVYLTDEIVKMKMKETMSQAGAEAPTIVRFVPNKATPKLGRVVSCTPEKSREIELIQTLEGFERAAVVACSFTGLLAVSDFDGQKVIIYHKVDEKYEVKQHLHLKPNKLKPDGVAIHPDGRYLLARGACIEVYSTLGQYVKEIQTGAPSGTTASIACIAATSDGRILAGDIARSVITVHDATGNIIRTMKTNIHPGFMTLIHIHDRHIAMSDWKTSKVSVMDMETEEETLSIDIPGVGGICYDEQTECLLIARNELSRSQPGKVRLNSGVIEQYSYTTGTLVACLEQGLYYPREMTLTGDGTLVVANNKDVKIYELK